jgi:ribonuclease Y
MHWTSIIIGVLALAAGLVVGGIGGYFYFRHRSERMIESAEKQAERILGNADTEAKERLIQAGDEALRLRREVEDEGKNRGEQVTEAAGFTG